MDRLERDKLRQEPLGIGEALREARESKHLTLARAAEDTKIRSSHLLALEEEDFAGLPAPVFTRGLLRTYSRYLGLNDEEIIGRLDSRHLLPTVAVIKPEVKRLRGGGAGTPRVLITLFSLAMLVGLGYYLYVQYSLFLASEPPLPVALPSSTPTVVAVSTPEPTPVPTVLASVAEPTVLPTTAPASPSPLPTRAPSPTPTAAQTITIEARFTGDSWMHVEVDDKLVSQGTLHAGDRREWTGKKVYLWVGNGAAVNVTFNGKSLGPLGAQGQVVHTTWTAS